MNAINNETDLFTQKHEAIAFNLTHSTIPFVCYSERKINVGSGTLIAIDNRLFVATAAHLLVGSPLEYLTFVTPNQRRNVNDNRFPIIGVGKMENLRPDVGYIEVLPELASILARTPISLDRVKMCGAGNANHLAFLCGYPWALADRHELQARDRRILIADFNPMYYTHVTTVPSTFSNRIGQNVQPVDQSVDIFLEYDRTSPMLSFLLNERRPNELPNPGGASGGGLWHSFAPDSTVWSAEGVKLFGIQSAWSEQTNYIRGSQIQHWLQLIYERELGLRNTIQSTFADVNWQTSH